MNANRRFIPYDGFKLLIAIILLLIIIGLWMTSTDGRGAPVPMADSENMEETVAEPQPTQEPIPTPQPEVELPPFPEPSEGLSYDEESGFIVNAEGKALYQLNEDGTGWVPVIPDEMKSMQISSEDGFSWSLGDADGAKYTWDAASHSWVEVPQEEIAEEPAQEETATVTACEGASPPQLSSGGEAEVLSNVNFRSSPGIGDNWIATLQTGSRLKVLGETACLPHGSGAYLWWQLEREDGTIGWTAEAPLSGTSYFIQPVE
ncbi:MAG: SH3 domain-containing protein [Anaerolineae bacterium]|jgi:hypothetical protein|nr:SH3 domain-containing protein [Anaerolineae bacterium]MBT7189910.1 SH3 domain-containing protein [Anaerolineae bacterium]MBT7991217.1 SH3 domain-containing protein [Anaerolineae bacterium]